jgi:hypothetical protein
MRLRETAAEPGDLVKEGRRGMLVRNGRLLGVMGRPRQSWELFFCPALVEIDDPLDCHPLADTLRPTLDVIGDFSSDQLPDGLWVRSRLPVVFGYLPLHIGDGRQNLLDHGFVAVLDAGGAAPTAIPFACADDCCSQCRLVISRSEERGLRVRIARCFWELLSVEGGDGQDFRAEGLEWTYFFNYDDSEELFTEVGRAAGRYYSDTTAWDCYLDPNFGRPDWSPGQWQCQWSSPRRRTRRCT